MQNGYTTPFYTCRMQLTGEKYIPLFIKFGFMINRLKTSSLIFLLNLVSSILFAQSPPGWALNFGGIEDDIAKDIAVDREGNSYVCGTFSIGMRFTPGQSMNYFTQIDGKELNGWPTNSFIVKYDPLGNYVWAKQITGPTNYDSFNGYSFNYGASNIVIDEESNLYISGSFIDTNRIDGHLLSTTKTNGKYIIKLDKSGNFIWSRTIGSNSPIDLPSIYYSGGKILAGVSFVDSVEIAGTNYSAGVTGFGNILATLDTSGNFTSVKELNSTTGMTKLNYTRIDSNGNLLVIGRFTGDLQFNNGSISNFEPNQALFIAKLDTATNIIFAKILGRCDLTYDCNQVSIDDQDNIYLAPICFSDTLIIDSFIQPLRTGGVNSVLLKFNSNGIVQWCKLFYSSGIGQYPLSIIPGNNQCIVAHWNQDTSYVDSTIVTTQLGEYLTLIDTSGNLSSSLIPSPWYWSTFTKGECDSLGNLYIISTEGNINGTIRITGYLLPSNGEMDGCLAKIESLSTGGTLAPTNKDFYIAKVYPNPATSELNVLLKNTSKISLFNSLGQLIQSCEQQEGLKTINTSDLNAGTYFLRINDYTSLQSFVVIIQ